MNRPEKDPPLSPAVFGELAAALRLAAEDLQSRQPPSELKARVLAAAKDAAAASARGVSTQAAGTWQGARGRVAPGSSPGAAGAGRAVQSPARGGWWAWSGAAACAAVLAASALLMLRTPSSVPVDDGVRVGGLGGGFLPLVPPERWPLETTPAWLVATELPRERMAALGLPYDPARAGDSVRAELLLHPSGEVLAVRFLH